MKTRAKLGFYGAEFVIRQPAVDGMEALDTTVILTSPGAIVEAPFNEIEQVPQFFLKTSLGAYRILGWRADDVKEAIIEAMDAAAKVFSAAIAANSRSDETATPAATTPPRDTQPAAATNSQGETPKAPTPLPPPPLSMDEFAERCGRAREANAQRTVEATKAQARDTLEVENNYLLVICHGRGPTFKYDVGRIKQLETEMIDGQIRCIIRNAAGVDRVTIHGWKAKEVFDFLSQHFKAKQPAETVGFDDRQHFRNMEDVAAAFFGMIDQPNWRRAAGRPAK